MRAAEKRGANPVEKQLGRGEAEKGEVDTRSQPVPASTGAKPSAGAAPSAGSGSGRKKPAGDTQWMQMSLALTIPMLLLSGPIVGFLIGAGLQRWLGWGDWIKGAMVLFGLLAGARETMQVIRKLTPRQ